MIRSAESLSTDRYNNAANAMMEDRANGAALDIAAKRMMGAAKTDEEKKYVENMIKEIKKEG